VADFRFSLDASELTGRSRFCGFEKLPAICMVPVCDLLGDRQKQSVFVGIDVAVTQRELQRNRVPLLSRSTFPPAFTRPDSPRYSCSLM